MKKIVLALFLFTATSLAVARDIKVAVAKLPSDITTFVQKHFPSQKITSASQESDDKDYNLRLSGGTQLEFGSDGALLEVQAKNAVPAGVLPQGITNYVAKAYPGASVKSVEHSKAGYDIKLTNKKHFQLDNQFKPTKFKEDGD
jgi:hypothetical protein